MPLAPLRKLLVPGILLIAAWIFTNEIIGLYSTYGQLLDLLPYITLIITASISIYYNRSRMLCATTAMLVIYFLIQTELQVSLAEPEALVMYFFMSISVPLTVLLLLILPERGINNLYGLTVMAVLPLQIITVILLMETCSADGLAHWIATSYPLQAVEGYILPIAVSISYAVALLTGLYVLIRSNNDNPAVLITVLIFCFVTFAFFDQARISTIMFSAAGIALIVGLMNSSYNMAFRDELTGLLGRRALNERMKGLRGKYVIAMTDVDHFKKFNDNYGHDVGDDVLSMVAKHISAVKGGGVAYRYGGEEFCIVFPGKTIGECHPYLESLRRSVENYRMKVRNKAHRPKSSKAGKVRRGRRTKSRGEPTVSMTISIGVAERNEQASQPEEVLKAADAALYQAKEGGRNCIRTANRVRAQAVYRE